MKRKEKKELRTFDCGNGHTHLSKYAAKNCAACAQIEAESLAFKRARNSEYGKFAKVGE